MKFLPPIIALILVIAWLGFRRHSLAAVRDEVTTLERRIARARPSAAGPTDDHSLASRVREERGSLLKPGEPIDWKRVADRFAASPEMNLPMRDFAALQQRVMEMSPAELVKALDEIDALGLPEAVDKQLEGMLLGQLARKDPQQALEKFGDQIGTEKGHYSWQLTEAISRWAEDDPAAATGWLDRKIAEGVFASKTLSGRNQDRIRFEAAIIGSLLPGNTATAVKRLAEVPDSQRSEILRQHWLLKLTPGDHLAFAELTRSSIPANQQPGVLGDAARSLARGSDSYRKVSGFIETIEARPEERREIADNIARLKISQALQGEQIEIESVHELRTWLNEQAPEHAGTIIGAGFGNHSRHRQQAVEIITELHAETGDDDLLTTYLDRTAKVGGRDISAAMPLVEKISDPQRREEFRTRLADILETAPTPVPK